MAGKSDRPILAAVLGLILCGGAASPAKTEIVRGESRELGVKFQVLGGSDWCSSRIRIGLTASNAPALQPESIPFLQMIGRIRAVVLSQCPKIERIAFEGSSKNVTVFAAEMSRLTKWRRFITFDPSSRQPNCPPAVPEAQCAKQAEAYVTAIQLFQGDTFAETEIVNTLEPDSNDLAFRSKNVFGKLRIVSHGEFSGQFSTAGQLADSITTDIGEACIRDGGRIDPPRPLDLNPDLARGAVLCRVPDRPDGQNVVLVWNLKDTFRVFSLLSEGAAAGEAWPFTGDIIRAIQAQR